MLVDLLGFPYPQHLLMLAEKSRRDYLLLRIEPEIKADIIHATCVPPSVTRMETMLHEAEWFRDLLLDDTLKPLIVEKKKDLDEANRLKFILGVQNPPEDASPDGLRRLKELGVRFMGLAYESSSVYGGGFAAPHEGLTASGERFLEMLAEAGMILDLSHASHRTADQALYFMEKKGLSLPVVVTHTNIYSVHPHLRNLSDILLHNLVHVHHGIVGLTTVTFMMDGSLNTLEPFHRHWDRAIQLLGEDNVAIGSDGGYYSQNEAEEAERFEVMKAKLDPRGNFRARYPDQPRGLNSPRRLLHLASEMGLSSDTTPDEINRINKIFGENAFLFLKKHI